MVVKRPLAKAAPDSAAKAAKVSSVASSSLLAIAEDPLKTPGPEWPPCNAQKLQKPVLPASDADHVARHVMKEAIPCNPRVIICMTKSSSMLTLSTRGFPGLMLPRLAQFSPLRKSLEILSSPPTC